MDYEAEYLALSARYDALRDQHVRLIRKTTLLEAEVEQMQRTTRDLFLMQVATKMGEPSELQLDRPDGAEPESREPDHGGGGFAGGPGPGGMDPGEHVEVRDAGGLG